MRYLRNWGTSLGSLKLTSRGIFLDGAKKQVAVNTFYLLLSQGVNFLIPLVQLPYLFRILAIEQIGVLGIAQSFAQYFIVILEFGFNYSATRYVAIHRNEPAKINKIFSSILFVKIIIGVVCCVVYFSVLNFVPILAREKSFYSIYFGVVIATILTPTWLFQGMEDLKYFTILNSVLKAAILVGLVLFVKTTNDFLQVSIITSCCYLIAGILSYLFAVKKYRIQIISVPATELVYFIKDGMHIFLANISATLYTFSNTFLLGLLTTELVAGYYSSAEKLVKAIQSIFSSFSTALFPYMSKRLLIEADSRAFIKKLLSYSGALFFFFSLGLFFGADTLTKLLFGQSNEEISLCIRILAPVPLITILSNILGINVMINKGYTKQFLYILLAAAVVNMATAIPLIMSMQHLGMAIAYLITEFFVTVLMLLFLSKRKVL